jgi:hypothetical protein
MVFFQGHAKLNENEIIIIQDDVNGKSMVYIQGHAKLNEKRYSDH